MEVNPELAAKVNVELFVGGPGDPECAEKIRLGLAANESVADAVRLNYTQLPEFALADVLISTEDVVAPVRDDMLEGYRMLTEFEGKTLAIPGSIKAKLWYYRTDVFEQAGIDPTQVKTIDDFIATGKKVQEIDPSYRMWALGDSNPMYDYMMVLSGTDARFCNENGEWQLTKNPAFAQTLEAFKRLLDEGVVSKTVEWTPDWEKDFADGVYVSYPNATWLASSSFLPKWAENQKGLWAVTQWPSFIGEEGGSEAGGDIYVIPKFSAEPDLAKEVLAAMFLSTEGTFIAKEFGGTPPIFKSAMQDPRAEEPHPFMGDSFLPETIKSIETYKLFPWDPCAAQELIICNSYFDAAVNGQMTIDEALAAAEADLQNQIGNPYDQ
jgi:ABC-type glycerol-3-phosphate transport system substrate-binding protein